MMQDLNHTKQNQTQLSKKDSKRIASKNRRGEGVGDRDRLLINNGLKIYEHMA